MANTIEIKVPDIGGHDNVPVIEVLVKAGDTVSKDQSLVTLESDKATMEIPSSAAGVIRELRLKVGDEVSEGAVIAILETDGHKEADGAAVYDRFNSPATDQHWWYTSLAEVFEAHVHAGRVGADPGRVAEFRRLVTRMLDFA